MSLQELTPELRHLAALVAPELTDRPLYIISHPSDLPTPQSCVAYTTGLDSLFRERLEAQGAWQGPGTNVVFVEQSRVANQVIGTFLHELAHNLPIRPLPPDEPPTAETRERHLTYFTTWAADTAPPQHPAWFPEHGRGFIRICIHLLYRAIWHRHYPLLSTSDIHFAGPAYELSPAHEYKAALGDEPARMIEASFSEIMAEPLPEAFTRLFRDDVDTWHKQEKECCNERVA